MKSLSTNSNTHGSGIQRLFTLFAGVVLLFTGVCAQASDDPDARRTYDHIVDESDQTFCNDLLPSLKSLIHQTRFGDIYPYDSRSIISFAKKGAHNDRIQFYPLVSQGLKIKRKAENKTTTEIVTSDFYILDIDNDGRVDTAELAYGGQSSNSFGGSLVVMPADIGQLAQPEDILSYPKKYRLGLGNDYFFKKGGAQVGSFDYMMVYPFHYRNSNYLLFETYNKKNLDLQYIVAQLKPKRKMTGYCLFHQAIVYSI